MKNDKGSQLYGNKGVNFQSKFPDPLNFIHQPPGGSRLKNLSADQDARGVTRTVPYGQTVWKCMRRFSRVRLLDPMLKSVGLCPVESSRQEYWSGLLQASLRDLPTQGNNPCPLCLLLWQAGSLPLEPPGKPLRPHTSSRGTAALTTLSALDTPSRDAGRGRSHQRALWKRHAGSALRARVPMVSPCSCVPSTWPRYRLY